MRGASRGSPWGKYSLSFDAPTVVTDVVTGKPLVLNTAHATTEHPAMLHMISVQKSAGQRFLGFGEDGGGTVAKAAAAKEAAREAKHRAKREAMLRKSSVARSRPWAESSSSSRSAAPGFPSARDLASAPLDSDKLAAWFRLHGVDEAVVVRSTAKQVERATSRRSARDAAARSSSRRLRSNAARVLEREDRSSPSMRLELSEAEAKLERRASKRAAQRAQRAAEAAAAAAEEEEEGLGKAMGVSIPLMGPPLFPGRMTERETRRLPRKLAAIKAAHIGELQNAVHEELELERRRNLHMSQCTDRVKLQFLRRENRRLRVVAKERIRDIEEDNELCLAATLVKYGYIR